MTPARRSSRCSWSEDIIEVTRIFRKSFPDFTSERLLGYHRSHIRFSTKVSCAHHIGTQSLPYV
jgi:hypothetical protein